MFKNSLITLMAAAVLLGAVLPTRSQAEEQSTAVKLAVVSEAAKKIIQEHVGKGKLGRSRKPMKTG